MRAKKTGVELIAIERKRQVDKEDYDSGHDDEHVQGELALAAVCYASPVPVYTKTEIWSGVGFTDPWPWDGGDDKRKYNKKTEELIHNSKLTTAGRIRNLTKAGALISAEIDRLQRT